MRTKNSTDTTVTASSDFQFSLPKELQLTPKWSVPVTKNATAHIYEIEQDKFNRNTGDVIGTQTVYRVEVTNNKTLMPPSNLGNVRNRYGYYDNSPVYENLHNVVAYIRAVSAGLAPKKTKVVRVDETDGDDE